jgi:SAM-dependent methyltransferase
VIRREVLRHLRLSKVLRRVRRGIRRFERPTRPAAIVAPVPTYPESFRIAPPPAPIPGDWPEPPVIESPFHAATTAATSGALVRYDVALFEELNAAYASHPAAPIAPSYDSSSLTERSRRRLDAIHDRIGLSDRTVLEIGCGAGYEIWFLAQRFRSDAWGIDISPRNAWPALRGDRVHLVAGDVADRGSLPAATFERVISFTVWEHITRPIEAIVELERVMKPGGLAWIRANLYRGPTASHRTRDIHFPFPHLLFTDEVVAEALGRAGRPALGSAWVNRLTWEQYEAAFQAAGLAILSLAFTHYPLDEPFYRRFEDVLGRYPKADLERGFFQVVLEKPGGTAAIAAPGAVSETARIA